MKYKYFIPKNTMVDVWFWDSTTRTNTLITTIPTEYDWVYTASYGAFVGDGKMYMAYDRFVLSTLATNIVNI